jgi:hypothetical protein
MKEYYRIPVTLFPYVMGRVMTVARQPVSRQVVWDITYPTEPHGPEQARFRGIP